MKFKYHIIIILLLFQTSAHAYIDPGFIGGFFSLIVASLTSLAVLFIFKPYYFFKNLFNKIFKRNNSKNNSKKNINKSL